MLTAIDNHINKIDERKTMASNWVIASESIRKLSEDNKDFKSFVETAIELLIRFERTFIICSKQYIPPILLRKDDGLICVALLSEVQGI